MTCVIVRLRFEGIHSWPSCPLPDVMFLRAQHRHEFHVVARKLVTHHDRDVEIIMLKRDMEMFCKDTFSGPHTLSCEMMADRLVGRFDLVSCEVSEDGENGAEVTQ